MSTRNDKKNKGFPVPRSLLGRFFYKTLRFFFRRLFTMYKVIRSQQHSEVFRFLLVCKIASRIYPKLTYTDHSKIWMEDQDFLEHCLRYESYRHAADRKYFLRSLLSLVDDVPGDTAECGVFSGASSWVICEHFKSACKTHYGFDSFEGLSSPSAVDGRYWHAGSLAIGEARVKEALAPYRVELKKGWIPDRFAEIADKMFCFVHIDVDLYQPTLDSLAFFYPRMEPGGIILFDDYGFSTTPGARKAVDDYMGDKPEKIIHVPTGQGYVVKK